MIEGRGTGHAHGITHKAMAASCDGGAGAGYELKTEEEDDRRERERDAARARGGYEDKDMEDANEDDARDDELSAEEKEEMDVVFCMFPWARRSPRMTTCWTAATGAACRRRTAAARGSSGTTRRRHKSSDYSFYNSREHAFPTHKLTFAAHHHRSMVFPVRTSPLDVTHRAARPRGGDWGGVLRACR